MLLPPPEEISSGGGFLLPGRAFIRILKAFLKISLSPLTSQDPPAIITVLVQLGQFGGGAMSLVATLLAVTAVLAAIAAALTAAILRK